jgi:hypothetical protein
MNERIATHITHTYTHIHTQTHIHTYTHTPYQEAQAVADKATEKDAQVHSIHACFG